MAVVTPTFVMQRRPDPDAPPRHRSRRPRLGEPRARARAQAAVELAERGAAQRRLACDAAPGWGEGRRVPWISLAPARSPASNHRHHHPRHRRARPRVTAAHGAAQASIVGRRAAADERERGRGVAHGVLREARLLELGDPTVTLSCELRGAIRMRHVTTRHTSASRRMTATARWLSGPILMRHVTTRAPRRARACSRRM